MSKPASKPVSSQPAKPHRRNSTHVPSGWEKHVTADGRRYYEDVVGQSTSWIPPEGATGGSTGRSAAASSLSNTANTATSANTAKSAKSANTAKPQRKTATTLPSGWVKRETEEGRPYYENTEDQSTSWTLPQEPTGGATNEIEILVKPATTAGAGPVDEDGGRHVRNATFLPSGWVRHTNGEGVPYYQSPDGDTQWEKPPTNK